LLKRFTIYRGTKIYSDQQTDKRGGHTAPKHKAFANTVGWRQHKTNPNKNKLAVIKTAENIRS